MRRARGVDRVTEGAHGGVGAVSQVDGGDGDFQARQGRV